MERANLFLEPLDDERQWFRYHHLFAEVLRQRLKRGATGDTVSALHRRATAWYEQQGLVVEAIHHAFLAGDVEWAARLIEQATQTLWMRGEQTTLLGWLKALPQAVVQARPRLLLAHAWTQFVIEPEQAGTVEAILQDMEVVLGCDDGGAPGSSREVSAGDGELAELRGTLKAIQAGVASMQGDIPRTIALAEAALASLPVDNVMWRTVAAVDLGIAYALSGDVQAASRTFAEAIALCRRAGNGYLELVATNGLAQVRMIQGQLRAAAALYRQAQDTAAQQGGGQLPYTGLLDLGLGKLLYESNDLESATQHLLQGIERLRLQARPSGLLEGYAALAQAKQAQGDEAGALAVMDQVSQVAESANSPHLTVRAAAYRARLWLMREQRREDTPGIRRAAEWIEAARVHVDDELSYQHEFEHITLARLLAVQGKLHEALRLLERLLHAAEAAGRIGTVIELLVVQAVAFQAHGNIAQAREALRQALALAEPEGYIRTFVDEGQPIALLLPALSGHVPTTTGWPYVERLLAAFGDGTEGQRCSGTQRLGDGGSQAASVSPVPVPPTPPFPVEPLSSRELEVLRLVAAGKSNAEIGRSLVIAVSTVKSHTNNIFGKLGVTTRTQAIARAHALHLV